MTTKVNSRFAPLSLRHNFLWTFAGNIIYGACYWSMLVVIAKLGTPEMVGQFALGIAICMPVILFTNLQLRAIQVTDAKNQFCFGDYVGLRLITTALFLLIILVIIGIGGYHFETTMVIVMVSLAKASDSFSDVCYGLLQKYERMDRIAISQMLKGPMSLAAMAMGIYLTSKVFWGALGLAVVWALIMIFYDVRNVRLTLRKLAQNSDRTDRLEEEPKKLCYVRWSGSNLKSMAWLALPLGLVMMLMSLNNNIPRYFIEHYLGGRDLGIFAALASLMGVGVIVINALGHSASPRLARNFAEGNRSAARVLISKLIIIGAVFGSAGVLVILICGKQMISFLFRPEYAENMDVLLWMMIGASVAYIASLLGYCVTAARYLKVQLPIFAGATLISFISSFLLIPKYGLLGAPISILLAVIVQATGNFMTISHALSRTHKPLS